MSTEQLSVQDVYIDEKDGFGLNMPNGKFFNFLVFGPSKSGKTALVEKIVRTITQQNQDIMVTAFCSESDVKFYGNIVGSMFVHQMHHLQEMLEVEPKYPTYFIIDGNFEQMELPIKLPSKSHMNFIVTATLPVVNRNGIEKEETIDLVLSNWESHQQKFERTLTTQVPRWFRWHALQYWVHNDMTLHNKLLTSYHKVCLAQQTSSKKNEYYALLYYKERAFDGDWLIVPFDKIISDNERICTAKQREAQRWFSRFYNKTSTPTTGGSSHYDF